VAQIHVSLMMIIYCLYQHFERRLHTARNRNMRDLKNFIRKHDGEPALVAASVDGKIIIVP